MKTSPKGLQSGAPAALNHGVPLPHGRRLMITLFPCLLNGQSLAHAPRAGDSASLNPVNAVGASPEVCPGLPPKPPLHTLFLEQCKVGLPPTGCVGHNRLGGPSAASPGATKSLLTQNPTVELNQPRL